MSDNESPSERTRVREIKYAIDKWATDNGHNVVSKEHFSLARAIYGAVEHRYPKRCATKGLLVDVDQDGDYCNPRLVDWCGPEEMLFPVDPATDEPVAEGVAHFAFPLPHPDHVPEI